MRPRFKSRVLKQVWTVDTSDVVEPVYFRQGERFQFRCSPTENWDACPDALRHFASSTSLGACVAKDEDALGETTFNEVLHVKISELLYPGDQSQPLENMYVYIVQDCQTALYAEIHAIDKDQWKVAMFPPTDEPDARELKGPCPAQIDMPEDVFRFFISKMRLSKRALEHLLTHINDCGVKQDLQANAPINICVPDPFRWAEDTHDKFFAPRVGDYARWTCDEELQSAQTVYQAMDGWTGGASGGTSSGSPASQSPSGELGGTRTSNVPPIRADIDPPKPDKDPLDVADDLDTEETKNYRKEFDEQQAMLKRHADIAGAYLAGWVDSYWHRTVEMAGQDGDDEARDLTTYHWAYISRDLNTTEPTRQLIDGLVRDKSRFIWTHIFASLDGDTPSPWGDGPVLSSVDESNSHLQGDHKPKWAKRVWSAVSALYVTMLPAVLEAHAAGNVWTDIALRDQLFDDLKANTKWLRLADDGDWVGLKKSIRDIEGRPWKDAHRVKYYHTHLQKYFKGTSFGKRWLSSDPVDRYNLGRDTGPGRVTAVARIAEEQHAIKSALQATEKEIADAEVRITKIKETSNYASAKWFGTYFKLPLDMILSFAVAYMELTALSKTFAHNRSLGINQGITATRAALDVAKAMVALTDFFIKRQMEAAGGATLKSLTSTTAVLSKAGTILTVVSSALEAINRGMYGYKEVGRADYGAAVGHGIALVGALFSIAGAVIMWKASVVVGAGVGSVVPGAGTAAGAIIAAIGAALAIAGALIVAYCRKNEFEDYARTCCFGDTPYEYMGIGDTPKRIDVHWSDTSLWRDHAPSKHWRNLQALLSNFTIQVEGSGHPTAKPESYLVIRPGMVAPGACFDIILRQEYGTGFDAYDRPFEARWRVDPFNRTATPAGNIGGAFYMLTHDPSGRHKVFSDDPENQTGDIYIPINPAWFYVPDSTISTGGRPIWPNQLRGHDAPQSSAVLVKLSNDDADGSHPDQPVKGQDWVYLRTMYDHEPISSLSTGNWYEDQTLSPSSDTFAHGAPPAHRETKTAKDSGMGGSVPPLPGADTEPVLTVVPLDQ